MLSVKQLQLSLNNDNNNNPSLTTVEHCCHCHMSGLLNLWLVAVVAIGIVTFETLQMQACQ
jgi:hypothetical protein